MMLQITYSYPEWHPKDMTKSPAASNPKADGSAFKNNLATTSVFVVKSDISNSTQNLHLLGILLR